MKNKSIATRSVMISTFLIIGCLAMLGTTYYAMQKLRVGGPIYSKIMAGKDLLADILPPPEYIIEPYLEATLALNDPSSTAQRASRLVALRKDYDIRHQFWIEQTFDKALQYALTVDAHKPAVKFWQTLENDFFPALARGDIAQAKSAYVRLTSAYNTHRLSIDKLVIDANAFVKATEDSANSERHTLMTMVVVVSGLMLILFVLSALAVAKGLVSPLTALTNAMHQLTSGRLDVPLKKSERKDEIGDMARALLVFRDAGLEKNRLEQETAAQRDKAERERQSREAEKLERDRKEERLRQIADLERSDREAEKARQGEQASAAISALAGSLDRLAKGDLQCQIVTPFAPTFEQLRTDFNAAVSSLNETILSVVASAQVINERTLEIASASEDLARRTEQQAGSLEESSAATNELSNAVNETADSSTKTKDVISDAKRNSDVGAAIIKKTISAMGNIRDSSQQISNIIGVVDEIAFQTNLLALNAGVEAARAGDSGRGFAVVATEVRALAQRSAEAAREIKGLISKSSDQVAVGFALVAETGDAIDRMMSQVSEIDGGIADIATRAIDQATTLKQVNTAIAEIDQTTQQNASMAEQATAACRTLARESEQLATMLRKFNVSGPSIRRGQPHIGRIEHRQPNERLLRA